MSMKPSTRQFKKDDPVTALLSQRALAPAAEPAADSAPGRLGPRAVLAVAVGAAALTAFGLAASGSGGVGAMEVVATLLLVAWGVAGLVLAGRAVLRPLGLIVEFGTLVGALALVGAGAATAEWTGTGAELADFARAVGFAFLPATALHLLLALPVGLLATAGRRTTTAIVYGLATAAALGFWLADRSPEGWMLAAAWTAVVAGGLGAANRRYVTSAGIERKRLQLIGCALATSAMAALATGVLHLLVGWPDQALLAASAFTVLIPVALGAGASTRLVGRVDRLLVHTVSIAGLTAVVAAVYLVVVLGLGRSPTDSERQLLLLSMAAAAIAALLYLPARERFAEIGNRLVYGERQAPDEVLRTFGSRLSRAIPMEELLLQLAESLRKTMSLRAAEVWTGTAERLERTASVPDRGPGFITLGDAEQPVVSRAGVSGNTWVAVWLPTLLEGRADAQLRVAPVSHSGDVLGLIVVERPAGGDQFTEEDDRVLTELARQVGLALHNMQLDTALQASLDEVRRQAEELRASRARIVATADAERRKIERNLHDGAQQHLVALAVNLRLTRDLLADDPEGAAEMLESLVDSVKDTVQELRDLAHGIYPPLLMDSGLPEALRAAGSRCPLDVTVDASGVGRYSTEIEAAVYFCCLEALQNASKHAPDATVAVTASDSAGRLHFEVADDGPGFDPAVATAGHGFVNMSDRLGAIGGAVTWDSRPGEGTRVHGSVPVPPR
jgi:signal transduction histidine kinase